MWKQDVKSYNYTKGRAVLLANSHAGEGPARDAGSNLRLLEAGRPGAVRRNGLFACFSECGQCATGAGDVAGDCVRRVWY